jgi:hypothetical protein
MKKFCPFALRIDTIACELSNSLINGNLTIFSDCGLFIHMLAYFVKKGVGKEKVKRSCADQICRPLRLPSTPTDKGENNSKYLYGPTQTNQNKMFGLRNRTTAEDVFIGGSAATTIDTEIYKVRRLPRNHHAVWLHACRRGSGQHVPTLADVLFLKCYILPPFWFISQEKSLTINFVNKNLNYMEKILYHWKLP